MAISQARTSPTTRAGIQPPRDTGTSRRALLGGGFALAGSWLLTGCVPAASDPAIPGGSRWPRGSLTDQPIVQKTLRAAPSIIDLGGTLAEALAALPAVTQHFDRAAIDHLTDPANYLGLAPAMVDRALAASAAYDR